jgi:hypothetical protein
MGLFFHDFLEIRRRALGHVLDDLVCCGLVVDEGLGLVFDLVEEQYRGLLVGIHTHQFVAFDHTLVLETSRWPQITRHIFFHRFFG